MKFRLLFLCLLMSLFLYGKETIKMDSTLVNPQILVEQTNLALRQVGHLLLTIEGNDSSTVVPVQRPNEQTFLLPIGQSFNYDTLPFLLQTALEDLEMGAEGYYVAVKDCESDTIILGYDKRQFLVGRVPCIGRHQYSECNQIFVTFPDRIAPISSSISTSNTFYTYGFLVLTLLLGGLFYWKSSQKPEKLPKTSLAEESKKAEVYAFGNCQLDVPNQFLYINGDKKSLTFREAKLLHYFAVHANQLLKRETLLEEVWGDEGVIVGRSLDVFVSRLRKILKADSLLSIKTVHGVGYRLEVQE